MKYDRKAIMKKAWEIKKENEKNIFGLCLKMAWAIAKKETETKELPELQGSEKQVAWAKDIREKIMKNFTFDRLMSNERSYTNGNFVDYEMERFLKVDVLTCTGVGKDGKETKYQQMIDEFNATHVRPDRKDKEARARYKEAKNKLKTEYKKWLFEEFKKVVREEKSASWWIDHRYA